MPRIILLDEATANQIAAGEVVERPASVVKELVENSFDAGATRITIEIAGGGLDEIKVVDNGCGMDEEDSATAFRRHATSKISSINDLEEICSLGFRGEALPSIAAVSKTVLITRPPEAVSGTRLEVQGGRIMSVSPAGCPPGASISIKELFFNTPARLKYMKSRSTEAGHISEIATKLALARPDVGIRLAVDGRTVFHSPGSGDLLEAAAAVYGPGTAREMLALSAAEDSITVSGLLAPPSVNRSTKKHITVIINGRYVRNYLAAAAIAEGYGTLMPRGRHPLAVLVVVMDPRLLDINVHPSKMVVRVTREDRLFNLIRRSVGAALRTDKIIPSFNPVEPGIKYNSGERSAYPSLPLKPRPAGIIPAYNPEGGLVAEETQIRIETGAPEPSPEHGLCGQAGDLLDGVFPIGFLPPTYILAGGKSGLFIIDHHAAHERILYEKFLGILSLQSVESQILLVPAVIHLSPGEYQAAEENLELLASLGINASPFGSGSVLIREIPAGLLLNSAEELIGDLLEYLPEQGSSGRREEIAQKIATSAACRAAVKSGTRSTLEEAWEIIHGLKETRVPYTCPHGRPTLISITEQELKARFRRT